MVAEMGQSAPILKSISRNTAESGWSRRFPGPSRQRHNISHSSSCWTDYPTLEESQEYHSGLGWGSWSQTSPDAMQEPPIGEKLRSIWSHFESFYSICGGIGSDCWWDDQINLISLAWSQRTHWVECCQCYHWPKESKCIDLAGDTPVELHGVTEEALIHQTDLVMIFVDFKKAFKSVSRACIP